MPERVDIDDHAAGRVAELGGVVVRDDLELLHRIDGQRRQLLRARQADGVRRVAAVEDEVLVARAAAGDGEDRVVLRGAGARVDHDDAGRQRDERRGGAVRQRQRRQHFARHGLRNVRRLRIDQRHGGFDRYRFALPRDVERDVDRERLADCERDRADRGLEAVHRGLDAVPAWDEGADAIQPLVVGDGASSATPVSVVADDDRTRPAARRRCRLSRGQQWCSIRSGRTAWPAGSLAARKAAICANLVENYERS